MAEGTADCSGDGGIRDTERQEEGLRAFITFSTICENVTENDNVFFANCRDESGFRDHDKDKSARPPEVFGAFTTLVTIRVNTEEFDEFFFAGWLVGSAAGLDFEMVLSIKIPSRNYGARPGIVRSG